MTDRHLDPELLEMDARVRALSRRVTIDPRHKHRIREELMRRHPDMSTVTSQRAVGMLLFRLTGTRRLTLVAPPALAAVLAVAIFLGGLPVSREGQVQSAYAAHELRQATAVLPTVTQWQWTIRSWTAAHGESVHRLGYHTAQQRLYINDHRARLYFYYAQQWYQVPQTFQRSHGTLQLKREFWQFQILTLAQRLATNRFSLLRGSTVGGVATEGVRYVLSAGVHQLAVATAWINRRTGLVVRLNVVITHDGRTVERDTADYHYGPA